MVKVRIVRALFASALAVGAVIATTLPASAIINFASTSATSRLWTVNPGTSSIPASLIGFDVTPPASHLADVSVSVPHHHLSTPSPVVTNSTDVWVANAGSVVEFTNANGTFVRWIHGATYDFAAVSGLSLSGADVWAADQSSSKITEFKVSNGALVIVRSNTYIVHPIALSSNGTDVMVLDANGSGDLYKVSTGAQVAHWASGTFDGGDDVTTDGMYAFITNSLAGTVSVIDLATGAVTTNTVGGTPCAVTIGGGSVFVMSCAVHNRLWYFPDSGSFSPVSSFTLSTTLAPQPQQFTVSDGGTMLFASAGSKGYFMVGILDTSPYTQHVYDR